LILLVTSSDDLTTDYLIRRIEERRIPFFRFNTEQLLANFDICLTVTGNSTDFSISDRMRGVVLRRDEIIGAYFRKPRPPYAISDTAENTEHAFNHRELLETLRSIWRMIPKERWLNHPEMLWLANNKVKQLMVARDIGFSIPDTLISSKSKEVSDFARTHGQDVIAKAVKNGFLHSKNSTTLIFTSSLDTADHDSIATADTVVPAMLQPRLNKELDIRITIVGQSIFSVALLSQEHAETSTDWRTWDLVDGIDLVHKHIELPVEITRMCLELNRRLQLRFSCVDMVLTKSGDYYFLEVNPNGQWAWIEDLVGLPIRDAIIDELWRDSSRGV
jgi:hypothetical protein